MNPLACGNPLRLIFAHTHHPGESLSFTVVGWTVPKQELVHNQRQLNLLIFNGFSKKQGLVGWSGNSRNGRYSRGRESQAAGIREEFRSAYRRRSSSRYPPCRCWIPRYSHRSSPNRSNTRAHVAFRLAGHESLCFHRAITPSLALPTGHAHWDN